MRGDSIRDLYAKTLALMGLGILAGAGALVDYWPTGIEFPVAASALALPDAAGALPVSTFELPAGASVREVRVRRVSRADATPTWLPVAQSGSLVLSGVDAVALNAPPAESAPLPVFVSAGREVALSRPIPAMSTSSSHAAPATLVASAPGESMSADEGEASGGFLTSATSAVNSAVKKTGTSIARTSAKTGASILDVFRAVNGAVRRVLPN